MRVKVLAFLLTPRKTISLILLGKKFKYTNPTHSNFILPRTFQIRNSYSKLYVHKPQFMCACQECNIIRGFDPIQVHVEFLVDKITLVRFLFPVLSLSSVSIIPQTTHSHTYLQPFLYCISSWQSYVRRKSSPSVCLTLQRH